MPWPSSSHGQRAGGDAAPRLECAVAPGKILPAPRGKGRFICGLFQNCGLRAFRSFCFLAARTGEHKPYLEWAFPMRDCRAIPEGIRMFFRFFRGIPAHACRFYFMPVLRLFQALQMCSGVSRSASHNFPAWRVDGGMFPGRSALAVFAPLYPRASGVIRVSGFPFSLHRAGLLRIGFEHRFYMF